MGCAVVSEELVFLWLGDKAPQNSSYVTLSGRSSAEWSFRWFTLANSYAKRAEVKWQLRIESRRLHWVGLLEGPCSLPWLFHMASFHAVSPPSVNCHTPFLCSVVRVCMLSVASFQGYKGMACWTFLRLWPRSSTSLCHMLLAK